MKLLKALCVAAIGIAVFGQAWADSYPSRPIRLIVPVPPGGANDLAARLVGEIITARTGQPVVIDNRGGAGGNIGMSAVAKSEPDGYTLLLGSSGQITTNRLLFKNPMLDPIADLEPIAPVGEIQLIAAVNKNVPASTLAEFVALAKAHPANYNYTSAGPGSSTHLAGDQLLRLANVSLTHVPYRGAGPALTDLLAGRVQMITLGVNSLMPHIRSGAVRPLVAGSGKRLAYLPDVPTGAEAGVPGWNVNTWFGLFGPRGVPKPIVDQLNGYVRSLARDPASVKRMQESYMDLMPMSAAQFAKLVRDDSEKWTRIVQEAGIQPE